MVFFCFVLLYDVELVSAVQQSEVALCVQVSPLLRLPPSPAPHASRSFTEHHAELPVLHRNFLPAIYFIYGSVSAACHPDHNFSPSSWVSFLVDGLLLSSLLI